MECFANKFSPQTRQPSGISLLNVLQNCLTQLLLGWDRPSTLRARRAAVYPKGGATVHVSGVEGGVFPIHFFGDDNPLADKPVH